MMFNIFNKRPLTVYTILVLLFFIFLAIEFRVVARMYSPTPSELNERLLGIMLIQLSERGAQIGMAESDCGVSETTGRFEKTERLGTCTLTIDGISYFLSVQFTETGGVEYTDMETRNGN